MSDAAPQAGEPTMEEILASIRRIISEEDAEAPAAAASAEPEAAAPAAEPEEDADDDVLELTDVVPEPAPVPAPRPRPSLVQPADDIVFDSLPEPAPEPELADLPDLPDFAPDEDEGIVAPAVIDRAASAFSALERDIAIAHSAAGASLEGLVREMMRPMLKQWLDAHLPDLVERVVRDEVERVASRRR
ncbi:MAG: DUF2497 domain-containing protein [Alphaproteobacteria bacterium]|nr:DUF2497 domain-containing protein [Alphaproteobacteria bacterium]